jgi:hypothetical protein
VPGYRPLRKLGQGTYGTVWLYEDENTGIRVAVKFFAHHVDEQWLLIQAEVKQLAMLSDDPGIVQLRDVDLDANPPYYVMTYAPGGSLAGRLEGGPPLGVHEALPLFRQVTAALAYVHAKGVRHCDLKPGNVLLDARGRALVADFGQAHIASDASPALGTFFYMAPEQADLANTIADTRWDVYGLGALFYAMLTGSPPREHPEIREELIRTESLPQRLKRYREHVGSAPRPTAHRQVKRMDRRLAEIIDRCLETDPARRWHDAGAVLSALERRDRSRRNRPLLLFGLLAPLVLLGLMAVGAYLGGKAALDQSSAAVLQRQTKNNRITAHLVANVLRMELNRRIDFIKRRAGDAQLRRDLQKDPNGRPVLEGHLKGFLPKSLDFYKLALADRRGLIVADEPRDPSLWERRWAWRDWYNGQGHRWGHDQELFDPVGDLHVSGPYRSREDGNPLIISISYPVRDPDDQALIRGVLVGSIHVEDLSHWVRGVGLDADHASVVLLNHERQFLKHPLERAIQLPPDRDLEPAEGPVFRDLIEARHDGVAVDHVDPLDGQTYVVGYAPVEDPSGWGVVVQHQRDEVLHPVTDLRGWLWGHSLGALALVGLFIVGLWSMLLWNLRNEERCVPG